MGRCDACRSSKNALNRSFAQEGEMSERKKRDVVDEVVVKASDVRASKPEGAGSLVEGVGDPNVESERAAEPGQAAEPDPAVDAGRIGGSSEPASSTEGELGSTEEPQAEEAVKGGAVAASAGDVVSVDSDEVAPAASEAEGASEAQMEAADAAADPSAVSAEDCQASDAPLPGSCAKCGAALGADQAFCGTCGSPVEKTPAPADEPASSSGSSPAGKAAPRGFKFNPKIAIGAVVALVVVVVAFFSISEITATPDDLFDKGRYEDAYNRSEDGGKDAMIDRIIGAGESELAYGLVPDDKKDATLVKIVAAGDFETAYNLAPEDRKQDVLVANIAAYLSNEAVEKLKDPGSFSLRKAYYHDETGTCVLEVGGNNSLGSSVSSWHIFSIDDKSGQFEWLSAVGSLEYETIYRYADTSREKEEKRLNNTSRDLIRSMIREGYSLDASMVKAVNSLFETSGGFDGVSLLPDAGASGSSVTA